MPPIVIGAGWFLLLRTVSDVFAIAPVMVVTVNAVMAMPFAIRAMRPAYDAASERHEGYARSSAFPAGTGSAWSTGRRCGGRSPPALPSPWRCRSAISASSRCSAAIRCRRLPYLLLARMGSYRTADAAGLALLLGAVCLALVLAADWLGRGERS